MRIPQLKRSPLLALGLMALLAGYSWYTERPIPTGGDAGRIGTSQPDLGPGRIGTSQPDLDSGRIEALFDAGRSGVVVEAAGQVVAVLRDDTKGSQHQRFIVRLGSGHSVLVSHNIDLAPRVDDIEKGDRVAFRGQYEWNDRGGVVHWTHHDPQGRRPGGWIERAGQRYR